MSPSQGSPKGHNPLSLLQLFPLLRLRRRRAGGMKSHGQGGSDPALAPRSTQGCTQPLVVKGQGWVHPLCCRSLHREKRGCSRCPAPHPEGCTQGCRRNVTPNKGGRMFGLARCHPESPRDCAFGAKGSNDTSGGHVPMVGRGPDASPLHHPPRCLCRSSTNTGRAAHGRYDGAPKSRGQLSRGAAAGWGGG